MEWYAISPRRCQSLRKCTDKGVKIHRTTVKVIGNMLEVDNKLKTGDNPTPDGLQTFKIKKEPEKLTLTFHDGTTLGFLNDHVARMLGNVLEQYQVELECLANTLSLRERIEKAVKASDTIVHVDINIYGEYEVKDEIGRCLSDNKLFLQRPNTLRNGIEYDNPHHIKFPDLVTNDIEYLPVPTKEKAPAVKSVEAFQQAISDVYASLKRADKLEREEGSDRIKTDLLS